MTMRWTSRPEPEGPLDQVSWTSSSVWVRFERQAVYGRLADLTSHALSVQ